jgi:hypothetical protein
MRRRRAARVRLGYLDLIRAAASRFRELVYNSIDRN